MMQDLHDNIVARRALSPQIQTNADTAFVSQIIDKAGFTMAEFLILWGALTDTNVTFVVLLEDGDDAALSDAAAVDDAFLLGTEALATALFSNDNTVSKLGYIGPKRYLRMTITPTGNNSGDINIAIVALLAGHRKSPDTTQLA